MALLQSWLNQLQPEVEVLKTALYNPLSISLLLLLISLLLFKLTTRKKLNFPPSPPKLPLIGNLHQLLVNPLPHRALQSLSKKYGHLMFVYFGKSPTLVVSSAEVAREIVKTHDIIFSNRPQTTAAKILLYGCQDIGFSNYGEYWRQMRKISVLELFSIKRVQSFQYVREEEVEVLMKKIRRSCSNNETGSMGPVNLTKMILAISNNIVSRCVLGRKAEEEDGRETKFGDIARTLMEQLASVCFTDMFPSLRWVDVLTGIVSRLEATFTRIDTLIDQVVEEHKMELQNDGDDDKQNFNGKDFVYILLQLQKDGMPGIDLTQDRLKATLLDMFVGGTDTTSTLIEWVMTELAKNPNLMKKAQAEVRSVVGKKSKIDVSDIEKMNYLKCVMKESLRLHPPVPLLVPRETSTNVELRGYHIPADTRVFINAYAIQRSPELWDRPEEFIPERFENNSIDYKGQDFQLIPFGVGRRGCPGVSFGVAAAEYAIVNLLYWFDWKSPGGLFDEKNFDMDEVSGLAVHKKFPLHLVPTLYSP